MKEFPTLRDDNLILKYAQKAISVNVSSVPRENRISISSTRQKQKKLSTAAQPPKLSITESIGNLQKRAFSWGSRDNGGSSTPVKSTPNSDQRKRKSSNLGPTEHGLLGDRSPNDGAERVQFVSVSEEWVLTGDMIKDDEIRSAHRYSSSPDITLFKVFFSFLKFLLGFLTLLLVIFGSHMCLAVPDHYWCFVLFSLSLLVGNKLPARSTAKSL